MKKPLLLLPALILLIASCGHEHKHSKTRTIDVTGSAEKDVTPDEVYYTVTLAEYMKGKTKIAMPELEAGFMKKAEAAGIKKEDIQVENSYMYNYYYYDYYYRHHHENYFASKTFNVKLSKPEAIEKLMSGQDSLNVTSASIQRFDNSNKKAYRDTLKIQALKAARKKAEMLLNSIGEELGPVISITEIETGQENYPYYYYGGYLASNENNVSSIDRSAQSNTAAFKDMKLRYEMKVVFEIK